MTWSVVIAVPVSQKTCEKTPKSVTQRTTATKTNEPKPFSFERIGAEIRRKMCLQDWKNSQNMANQRPFCGLSLKYATIR
jgi:hypothetical protein